MRQQDDGWGRARPERARAPPSATLGVASLRNPWEFLCSLALRELKEERAFRDDLLTWLDAGCHFVLITDARAERDAPTLERAIRRGNIDERQILLVAENGGRGDEKTRVLVIGVDADVDEHVFAQHVVHVRNED